MPLLLQLRLICKSELFVETIVTEAPGETIKSLALAIKLYKEALGEVLSITGILFGIPVLFGTLGIKASIVGEGSPCSQFLQSNQSVLTRPVHLPAVPVRTVTAADPVRPLGNATLQVASLKLVTV